MKFKLKPVKGKTNWQKLDKMTEAQIHANALSDPENPPLTEDELKRFKRVPKFYKKEQT